MQLKIILNRLQKHSAFVYETVRLVEHPRLTLEVRVRPRAGTRATCSQCRRRAPGYDTQAVRRFDFVPLWHIPVVFLYAMRRVSCPRCGVRVEAVPWATGKHRLTDAYAWFLAGWAKRLSWQEVAAAFPTSWDTVYRAVRMAVDWGLAHRDLTNIEAIGVDELSRRRGQRYLTLVYQIDGHCKRLLWVGRERKAKTLEGFFDWFGAARSAALLRRHTLEIANEQQPEIPTRPQTRAAQPTRVEGLAQPLHEGVKPGFFQDPVQPLEERMSVARRKVLGVYPHR